MQIFKRLYVAIKVTLLAGRFGCTKNPGTTDMPHLFCENGRIPAVDIALLEKILTTPDKFLDKQGCLNMTIADCSLLAAPALLFFFKRRGFSRCRAWNESTGITFSASR
jgi:hypothetical protein